MEQLQYVIEDSTIAELLGVQNFTSDSSAVLELVKNAYDAEAKCVILEFADNSLVITDDGHGMNASDIREHWMHIGKSDKSYDLVDNEGKQRVLAGAKGVGRFALARLGRSVKVYSQKPGYPEVVWSTDWNHSTLQEIDNIEKSGSKIYIENLREKWSKKKVQDLREFLSKTYNATEMKIQIIHPDLVCEIKRYFDAPQVGINCLSQILFHYDSHAMMLYTEVINDEFSEKAEPFCEGIDIRKLSKTDNMLQEFLALSELDLPQTELETYLKGVGNFAGELYFYLKPTKLDVEKFFYKHYDLPDRISGGVILYRNAFSISAYEGDKDWLELGKRSRKSPAAASHPTGAWRVRENQISGKIQIDKRENANLRDLSNRQGLDENIYYDLFVAIIQTSLKRFEYYRQSIIRHVDVKNKEKVTIQTPVSDRILSNPKKVAELSHSEAKQLADEIRSYRSESKQNKIEKENVEKRYKYDVRILNALATIGLKAASIAHEMKNDRNTINDNTDCIIEALKKYDMWDELLLEENTAQAYRNVPHLLESNKAVSTKLIAFMNAMLTEIEKKQFIPKWQSVLDVLQKLKSAWEKDYAWLTVNIENHEDICCNFSEDTLRVIFDNLILNSVQQNEDKNRVTASISVSENNGILFFSYKDDGKGLPPKYIDEPERILIVHETSRKNGHGLGMWIVNNTVVMSGGKIESISGRDGFSIDFTIRGAD